MWSCRRPVSWRAMTATIQPGLKLRALVRQMIAGRSTVLIYWLKYLFPCRAVLIREMLAIIESSTRASAPVNEANCSSRWPCWPKTIRIPWPRPSSGEREDMLALWPTVQRHPEAMQASLQRRFDHWTRRIANSDQQWLEPSAQISRRGPPLERQHRSPVGLCRRVPAR